MRLRLKCNEAGSIHWRTINRSTNERGWILQRYIPVRQCNATPRIGSDGHYEVEGVAPGIYNLYASAAGYPTTLIASNVQVLKGQSLHFDGYLNPGPVIHGTVFSKHSFGSEPWPFYGDTGPNSGEANSRQWWNATMVQGSKLR